MAASTPASDALAPPASRPTVQGLADHALAAAYPGAHAVLKAGQLTPGAAATAARAYAASEHPRARCVLLFGSSLSGGFRSYSDLDLLVIDDEAPAPVRGCVMHGGLAIEYARYRHEHIQRTIDMSLRLRRPYPVTGWADAILVSGDPVIFDDIVGACRAASSGRPATEFERRRRRVILTSQWVDLLHAPSDAARIACGLSLYSAITSLLFAQTGGWDWGGRWTAVHAPHALDGWNTRLQLAYGAVFQGHVTPLAELALEVLTLSGGAHWAGHSEPAQ